MKKLIVSIQSSSETLSDFKKALKAARKGRLKGEHFELSFDNKKDFDRFIRNLGILSAILVHKPKSVYELAKLVDMDVSNLNKIILEIFPKVVDLIIKKRRPRDVFDQVS